MDSSYIQAIQALEFSIPKKTRCLWYQHMKQLNKSHQKCTRFLTKSSAFVDPRVTQLWPLQHLQSLENILLQSCLAYYAWSHIVTSLPVCQFTEKHPSYFCKIALTQRCTLVLWVTMKSLRICSSPFPRSFLERPCMTQKLERHPQVLLCTTVVPCSSFFFADQGDL